MSCSLWNERSDWSPFLSRCTPNVVFMEEVSFNRAEVATDKASCSLVWQRKLLRRLVELPERDWGERLQASQPGKREHQMLVVSCALGVEGFAMKEEGSRWFSCEPSQELQRKKENG